MNRIPESVEKSDVRCVACPYKIPISDECYRCEEKREADVEIARIATVKTVSVWNRKNKIYRGLAEHISVTSF